MPPLVVPVNFELDPNSFNAMVVQSLVDHLRQVFNPGYVNAVKARMGAEAGRLVRASSEYAALHGGELQGQMGVQNPTQAIEDILLGLIENIDVMVDGPRVSGQSFTGSVTASILRSDFKDVLDRAGAKYNSGRYTVEWLRWLLLEGDRIVVSDYAFLGNPTRGGIRKGSRTDLGIMRKGGGWRVPPGYAGTAQRNWLTESLGVMRAFIADILVDELQKRF